MVELKEYISEEYRKKWNLTEDDNVTLFQIVDTVTKEPIDDKIYVTDTASAYAKHFGFNRPHETDPDALFLAGYLIPQPGNENNLMAVPVVMKSDGTCIYTWIGRDNMPTVSFPGRKMVLLMGISAKDWVVITQDGRILVGDGTHNLCAIETPNHFIIGVGGISDKPWFPDMGTSKEALVFDKNTGKQVNMFV